MYKHVQQTVKHFVNYSFPMPAFKGSVVIQAMLEEFLNIQVSSTIRLPCVEMTVCLKHADE